MLPASGAARAHPRDARDRVGVLGAVPHRGPPVHATRARIALTVAVVALFVAAPVGAASAAPGAAAPVPMGSGVGAGVDLGPVPPAGRPGGLVRWRSDGFAPVRPGSVAAGRVHVVVPAGPAGSAWAAVRRLARAVTAADPGATVLAYSWPAPVTTSRAGPGEPGRLDPSALTDRAGQRLARAWARASAPRFAGRGGMLHLVGDGPGARVATVAALRMVPPPDHLTLLDSPERAGASRAAGTANRLAGYLPRLVVGRAPGTTRVDSYDSGLGSDYGTVPGLGAVVDVRITARAGSGPETPPAPGRAIGWYTASVRSPTAGVGWAWSPLAGGSFEGLAAAYRTAGGAEARRRFGGPDRALVERSRSPGPSVVAVPVAAFERAGATAGNPEAAAAVVTPGRAWSVDVATGRGDLGLALDYRFLRGADGSRLTVRLDGTVRAVIDGAYAGRAGQRLVIDVAGLAAGHHALSVHLDPVGRPGPGPTAGDRREPGEPAVALADLTALRTPPGAGGREGGPAARVGALAAAALVVAAGLAGVVAAPRRRRRRTSG